MTKHKYLGMKVKALRTREGMTLVELSEATGLSTGYLSQLERGLTTIAIDSLEKISQAFDKNITYFFSDDFSSSEKEKSYDLKKAHERTVSAVDKYYIQYHLLNDPSKTCFLPRYYEVLPKTELEGDPVVYTHEGSEFIFILEGVLTVKLEEGIEYLYEGDSILIDSNKMHTWVNDTGKIVKFIIVHSHNPYFEAKTQ